MTPAACRRGYVVLGVLGCGRDTSSDQPANPWWCGASISVCGWRGGELPCQVRTAGAAMFESDESQLEACRAEHDHKFARPLPARTSVRRPTTIRALPAEDGRIRTLEAVAAVDPPSRRPSPRPRRGWSCRRSTCDLDAGRSASWCPAGGVCLGLGVPRRALDDRHGVVRTIPARRRKPGSRTTSASTSNWMASAPRSPTSGTVPVRGASHQSGAIEHLGPEDTIAQVTEAIGGETATQTQWLKAVRG